MFAEIVARIERRLREPLPGEQAQRRMMPQPPRPWPSDFDASQIRHAAGLLLLFPLDRQAHLVLTVRAGTLGRHGGQVSLPGGVIDRGETIPQAALREAHEEIGLDPAGVRMLGALTPIEIRVSGFQLHPVVGAVDRRPALQPAHGEVAKILEIPVERLADRSCIAMNTLTRDGQTIVIPTFVVDGIEIWGATAMILSEFLEIAL
jgi:8-oxo-dGTP pyrophosphatase MutT (NUDIX family)